MNKEIYTDFRECGEHNTFPNIIFEPASHASERDALLGKWKPGDNIWNPEVWKRMREYQPEVIFFDSLDYDYPFDGSRAKMFLPETQPEIENGKNPKYLYVGLGDVRGQESLTDPVLHVNIWEDKQLEKHMLLTIMPQIIAGGMMMSYPFLYGLVNSKISRREFLKRAPAAVAGLVISASPVLSFAAQEMASYSESTAERDYYEKLSKLNRINSRLYEGGYWWLHGRTALLIAKTQDTLCHLDMPNDTSAAIVMGTGHLLNHDLFMNDKDYRLAAIRRYARKMKEVTIWMMDELGVASSKEEVTSELLAKTTSVNLVRLPILNDGNLTWRENIEQFDTFESEQVVEAISGIY